MEKLGLSCLVILALVLLLVPAVTIAISDIPSTTTTSDTGETKGSSTSVSTPSLSPSGNDITPTSAASSTTNEATPPASSTPASSTQSVDAATSPPVTEATSPPVTEATSPPVTEATSPPVTEATSSPASPPTTSSSSPNAGAATGAVAGTSLNPVATSPVPTTSSVNVDPATSGGPGGETTAKTATDTGSSPETTSSSNTQPTITTPAAVTKTSSSSESSPALTGSKSSTENIVVTVVTTEVSRGVSDVDSDTSEQYGASATNGPPTIEPGFSQMDSVSTTIVPETGGENSTIAASVKSTDSTAERSKTTAGPSTPTGTGATPRTSTEDRPVAKPSRAFDALASTPTDGKAPLYLTFGPSEPISCDKCNFSYIKTMTQDSFRSIDSFLYVERSTKVFPKREGQIVVVRVVFNATALSGKKERARISSVHKAIHGLKKDSRFTIDDAKARDITLSFAALYGDVCASEEPCKVEYTCDSSARACVHRCSAHSCSGHGQCRVLIPVEGAATAACLCDLDSDVEYHGDHCELSKTREGKMVAILGGVLGSVCAILLFIVIVMCIKRKDADLDNSSKYVIGGVGTENPGFDSVDMHKFESKVQKFESK